MRDAYQHFYQLAAEGVLAHKGDPIFSAQIKAPLPPGRWHVFEFWKREYIGLRDGSLRLPVPPRGCLLLRITPHLGRPQIIGSTFHITQGAAEIAGEEWDGSTLRVQLRPVARQDGELFVWRPDGVHAMRIAGLTDERTILV